MDKNQATSKDLGQYPVTPADCPKFQNCSAPVCPLDRYWRWRKHLKGDRVCAYLLESFKDGAEANLKGVLPEPLRGALRESIPAILERHGPIRKATRRARYTGSRIVKGRRLNLPDLPPTPLGPNAVLVSGHGGYHGK